MPKVTYVHKARKSNRRYGIKKGLPYWWWKRRAPGQVAGYRVVSLKPPRASQLTGSPFVSQVLALEEDLQEVDAPALACAMKEAAEELRELGEEQQEKLDNMPESLQRSPTGELLAERKEQCETVAEELERAAEEIESLEADELDAEEVGDGEGDFAARAIAIYEGVCWDFN